MMRLRVLRRVLLGWSLALLLGLGLGATSALAAESYVFNPQLSVTGGCTTSASDLVPDPSCPGGPPESFVRTRGMALDSYGDVYVAVAGREGQNEARIDIFNAESEFLTELPQAAEPRTVAVDSKGYLYVYLLTPTLPDKIVRYKPSVYNPAADEIAYETPPTVIAETYAEYSALAVNPLDDHLFIDFGDINAATPIGSGVQEFGSGEEGNPDLDSAVASVCCEEGSGLALDATRGRLYVTDQATSTSKRVVQVFELAAPHDHIETITGSSTPDGSFVTPRALSLAVDESTGNLFAYEQEQRQVIWELTETGDYLSTIKHDLLSDAHKNQVVVDNGEHSPHGQLSSEGRLLWATTSPSASIGHAYAFEPRTVCAPEVVSVSFSDVSEDEALLQASVNPCKADTSYTFEYVSRKQFEEHQFEQAQVAGAGSIPGGKLPVEVSAEATGLSPGTRYVFRVTASNEVGSGEKVGEFKTYPATPLQSCPNAEFRTGPSSFLPDCRAYELVTPPDTGGRLPTGLGGLAISFTTLPASPDGNRVSFRIESGLIPGSDGTGSFAGDPYLSSRGPGGWSTTMTGAVGTQASAGRPGARSPDQSYSVWGAEGQGPAVIGGETTYYVRYPDGHSELVGRGSLADDAHPEPELISENGGHIIFTSTVHLEKDSPPNGQLAVYDRTADEVTHVVSLLPGGGMPTGVSYEGSSFDGLGVAFKAVQGGVSTLYLRYNDESTYKIGNEVTFAGIAEGGKRIFYQEGGNLRAFDVDDGVISFAPASNARVVNVSADGSTAYFVSPSKLTTAANPLGQKAALGKENLYRSHEGSIAFVGTVSEEDVAGEIDVFNGLGLWTVAVARGIGGGSVGDFAIDPSRTTADGHVLLFESNAGITGGAALGSRQIYRYDAAANELTCISCNPTGAPASGEATLQDLGELPPNSRYDLVRNLSASGRRAFFQSDEPLVAADTDGLQDVYEWEAQGVGSCSDAEGCLSLISSGHSEEVNYLYAVSDSGDDVFFRTSDLLLPADGDTTPSIYDARVGGGFAEAAAPAECQGEGCRPQLTPAPTLPTPGMSVGKTGNVAPKCPKGKRKVRHHGKVRCVKKKHRHHHGRTSGKKKGAAK